MSQSEKTTIRRILAGAKVGIPPRQLSFLFPRTAPQYLYGDNATASLFFATLSGIFPPGEMFFVDSVKAFRQQVTEPKLKAAVSGFIGQEAIHSREHERLNEFWLERGINTRIPERFIRMSLGLLGRFPAKRRLMLTSMMEHFTAALGERLLVDEQFRQQADPELLKIWQWHALEELEHKAVTYDVLKLVSKSERRERIITFAVTLVVMAPPIFAAWFLLIAMDPNARRPKDLTAGLRLLFGKEGFVTQVLPLMADYWAKEFHPNDRDTKALEAQWREILFGPDGQLREEWGNEAALAA